MGLVCLVVALVGLGGWLLRRDAGTGNVSTVAFVEASPGGVSIKIWMGDSCSGDDAEVGIDAQDEREVVVFARPHPGHACADGGGSTGTVQLDEPLGERRIVVLQPPGRRDPVTCRIDDVERAICDERVTGEADDVFN